MPLLEAAPTAEVALLILDCRRKGLSVRVWESEENRHQPEVKLFGKKGHRTHMGEDQQPDPCHVSPINCLHCLLKGGAHRLHWSRTHELGDQRRSFTLYDECAEQVRHRQQIAGWAQTASDKHWHELIFDVWYKCHFHGSASFASARGLKYGNC
jgi:hypothetical protein